MKRPRVPKSREGKVAAVLGYWIDQSPDPETRDLRIDMLSHDPDSAVEFAAVVYAAAFGGKSGRAS